jgi:hypothetical protein
MSDDRNPKRPGDYAIEQFEALRPLAKLLSMFDSDIEERLREAESQFIDVNQLKVNLDLFAKTYSRLGWTIYDRLSVKIIETALSSSTEEGEAALTAYHLDSDNLLFFGYRFSTAHYEPWRLIYERAVERTAAGDYLSAIPLVLGMIDGICTTSTGKHPFSGGTDAPVFDSQTSGPGGLPEGLALLGSTRRKFDAEPIAVPFRHGIVHGLNPNYGNPIVAAKAFNLLQAMIDYFDRKRDEAQRLAEAAEEQKAADIREIVGNRCRAMETLRLTDEWRARPSLEKILLASSEAPTDLPIHTPEKLATEYLNWFAAKNYGALAKATVDFPNRPIGYRAGRLRDDLKEITTTRWTITGIEDTSAAMSRVTVSLEGQLNGQTWGGEHNMRLIFADENYEAMVRGQPGGTWFVMPDFLTNVWLVVARSTSSN